MKSWVKALLIFVGGAGSGAGVATIITKKVVEKKVEEGHREEMADLREHYEKKINDLKAKLPKCEQVEDKKDSDGIVTVGKGTPEEKQTDTHKTEYGKYYDIRKARDPKEIIDGIIDSVEKSAHPGEDDEPEEMVYEVMDYRDPDTGEPGFGQKPGFYTVDMCFYQDDQALCMKDWGDLTDVELARGDREIHNDEDEIRNDILPYLLELGFEDESFPYDIIKIRDKLRGLDVRVVRVDGSSIMDQI